MIIEVSLFNSIIFRLKNNEKKIIQRGEIQLAIIIRCIYQNHYQHNDYNESFHVSTYHYHQSIKQ